MVEFDHIRDSGGSLQQTPPTLSNFGATPPDFYRTKANSLCEFVKNISPGDIFYHLCMDDLVHHPTQLSHTEEEGYSSQAHTGSESHQE